MSWYLQGGCRKKLSFEQQSSSSSKTGNENGGSEATSLLAMPADTVCCPLWGLISGRMGGSVSAFTLYCLTVTLSMLKKAFFIYVENLSGGAPGFQLKCCFRNKSRVRLEQV